MQSRNQPDREGDMERSLSIIDAWMQHPTPRFLAEPMFDSMPDKTSSDGSRRPAGDGGMDG